MPPAGGIPPRYGDTNLYTWLFSLLKDNSYSFMKLKFQTNSGDYFSWHFDICFHSTWHLHCLFWYIDIVMLSFCVQNVNIPFLVLTILCRKCENTVFGYKKGLKKNDKKISSFTSETLFQHDFYFTKFKTMNFDNFFTNDRFPVFFRISLLTHFWTLLRILRWIQKK